MERKNFLKILSINIRLNIKQTAFPAICILLFVPLIYGISNLNEAKSADCLERMIILIGIPLFVPLLKTEQNELIMGIIKLRDFPYQRIVSLRLIVSTIFSVALVGLFEVCMKSCGSIFPFGVYMIRSVTGIVILGLFGLLISCISNSTIIGYLGSFCIYFIAQIESLGSFFKIVTEGISVLHIVLIIAFLSIIFFSLRE